jgi:hypothetical protein
MPLRASVGEAERASERETGRGKRSRVIAPRVVAGTPKGGVLDALLGKTDAHVCMLTKIEKPDIQAVVRDFAVRVYSLMCLHILTHMSVCTISWNVRTLCYLL